MYVSCAYSLIAVINAPTIPFTHKNIKSFYIFNENVFYINVIQTNLIITIKFLIKSNSLKGFLLYNDKVYLCMYFYTYIYIYMFTSSINPTNNIIVNINIMK